jgi:hypothetical protein
MDDIQLYQIFWSFLIVYIISLMCYCVFVILSIIYDSPSIVKYTFRLLMFILIYQFIEIILRRYDFLLIFLRIVMILLMKIWLSLTLRIRMMIMLHPEFATLSVSTRLFNRNITV